MRLPRPRRFRTKVFLAVAGLVCASLAAVLLVVEDLSTRRLRGEFHERFARTLAAFRQMQALRAGFLGDEIESLAGSNVQLRTVLSTASLGDADLGVGEPGGVDVLADANARLRSFLPSVPICRESEVFLVVSASGDLLFSKADPERFGESLRELALYRSTLARGEGFEVWSARRGPSAYARLVPAGGEAAAWQVLGAPVVFEQEIHGVVLVGSRLDRERLAEIASVSGVELALFDGEELLASTLPRELEPALAALRRNSATLGDGAPDELSLGARRFLAELAPIVPGVDARGTGFLVLSGIDAELAALRALRARVLGVGGVVLLAALATSFALARGITRPVAALGRAARRIGAGDLSAEVGATSSDELGDLARAFDEMVRGLRERDFLRRTFERYVSKPVAAEILANPGAVQRRGVRRELTVMFVDLGGFTALAESLEPEAVVAHLNEFFEACCAAILERDGTVKEFQGDAVVAFWGAPLAQPDHAARGCLAALAARERLAALVARWAERGVPAPRFRIGLHTGELVVGEIGSAERVAYGVVGDAMNLASRIEGANKAYGTEILISEATRVAAGAAIVAREIDRIRVVGRRAPVRVFQPLCVPEDVDAKRAHVLERYETALRACRARDFATAERGFAEVLALDMADVPARLWLERARAWRAAPPPPDWDGVHDVETK